MYAQISEGLYLVRHELELETTVQAPVNHIWIFDRSGSMQRLLPRLVDDLIGHTNSLKVGDTLSVGWFSGEGQYRFILKGYEITDGNRGRIKAILEQYRRTVGRTCFSEILGDAEIIADELSVFEGPFALMFLTDGYPVVSNYSYELQRIFETLERLRLLIPNTLFVGYGDFYNRDLMATMAASMGGTLIHSSRLIDFTGPMDKFVQSVSSGMHVALDIQEAIYRAAVIGKNFVGNAKSVDHAVLVSPDTEKVAVLTRTEPKGKEVWVSNLLDEAYAVAYTCALEDPQISLQVMQAIGDVEFIDGLTNAWTNDEYGRIANRLGVAVFSPRDRFLQGKDLAYSVPSDAFCLLDLMFLLAQDDQARFYPTHKSFSYKRIGAKTRRLEGYPYFNARGNGCRTSDLVWNSERMNLSIRAKIQGVIELSEDAKDFGFNGEYPTYVWRNYTLVRDGNLNVTALPVSVSAKTHEVLCREGLVEEPWVGGKPYVLNLEAVPIVNRDIAEMDVSAEYVCNKIWQKLEIDGILKALKSLRKEFAPEKRLESDLLSDDQISYLESQGITRHGFSPPVEKEETDDVYHANTLKMYPARFSSLPSLNAVRKKHGAGKKQTPSGELVLAGLKHFWADCTYVKKDEIVAWLDNEIKQYKEQSTTIAYQLQEAKFAVLAGKRWFTGLPAGDEVTYKMNGLVFIFKKGKKEIKY